MTFEEKIKEILTIHEHIKPDDWENICYALFLQNEHERKQSKYILESITDKF